VTEPEQLTETVAAASAAYVYTLLPDLAALPPRAAFERLKAHFEAALIAYTDGLDGWGEPEPGGKEEPS
jgi:hypothetical protein